MGVNVTKEKPIRDSQMLQILHSILKVSQSTVPNALPNSDCAALLSSIFVQRFRTLLILTTLSGRNKEYQGIDFPSPK